MKTTIASARSFDSTPRLSRRMTWTMPLSALRMPGCAEAHAVSAAAAASGDVPGFNRPMTSTAALVRLAPGAELVDERERRPVVLRPLAQPAEVFRHDAGDFVRMAVDEQLPSDDRRVRGEQLLPALVAQHDHRPSAALVISLRQRPSARRGDTEHVEEVAGDEHAASRAAVDARGNARTDGRDVREHVRFAAKRLVLQPA